ncbi:MAG: AbrB/MazE/SpoVT family DNA-binding domain-containing protein [Candidatus Rokuibacteriota bacterium]
MKARLVRIGNSRGVRLLKTLIEEAGQPQSLCCPQGDDEVVPGWQLDRELGRLGAPQDPVHVAGQKALQEAAATLSERLVRSLLNAR